MRQLVLSGNTVKRLLYKSPIINENYSYNGISFDLRDWTFNNNQPSDGITVSKGKIVVTKFKPNEPIIISAFTGTSSNNTPKISELCAISKNMHINIKGMSENSTVFGADKYYSNTNILSSGTIGYIYGLGFLPYKTTYREGRPLEKWGEMPFSCYVWGNITLSDNSSVQIASETTYLRTDVQGAYNKYGKTLNYNNKQIFPDWLKWYGEEEGAWYDTDFQLSIGLYTNVQTDNDGFIELNTPVEISLINLAATDPTTQEAFKLYVKDQLIYERDRTVDNLYKVFNLLKEKRDLPYKTQWQVTLEDGVALGYNIGFEFDKSDYDFQKITLPVATDLVQQIQNEVPFKFHITQYDEGRNEFWKTVVQTINNKTITDINFCYKLFSNAKGLAELDWNQIGDNTLHGLLLNLGSNNFYVIQSCFEACDIPAITINCQGIVQDLGDTFKGASVKYIKFGSGIIIRVLSGSFEFTGKLESVEGLTLAGQRMSYDGVLLSDDVLTMQYAFEGTALETINIGGTSVVVYPFAAQIFGSGCKLREISNIIFDFKFIDPDDMPYWGVPASYGHPIFGDSVLESIKIKNLNKGDWTIPMPLDDTSVIYMLNNIFDLTTNAGNEVYALNILNNGIEWNVHYKADNPYYNNTGYHNVNIERECIIDNMDSVDRDILMTWDYSHKYNNYNNFDKYTGIKKLVLYYKFLNAQNVNSLTKLNFTVQVYVRDENDTENVLAFVQTYNDVNPNTDLLIDFSQASIDGDLTPSERNDYPTMPISYITISTNEPNNEPIILGLGYKNEVSGVTSATLTFTNVIYKADFDSAIAVAQARGWTINFNS
jgi:hypothetical protein